MGMSWEPDINRRLTDREWQIWGMVSNGMGNDEIGTEIGVTSRTIESVVSSLYFKLNIPDGSARRVKLALIYPRRIN